MSTTTNDMPAFAMHGLSFAYDDGRPVLEDVDIEIDRRDVVAIVGPNGGGKTTLLRLLLGLETPTRGEVRVLGKDPRQARPLVGYMPQHTALDPRFPVRVLDVVLMGRLHQARWFGGHSRADVRAAQRALADVALEGFEKRPFAALSGGERQRVLIARALASEPALLLLDEPTANVDQAAGAHFHDLLAGLASRMTVVLVSHDLGFVSRFVSKVVCVHRRVRVHPTSEVNGRVLRDLYGEELVLVRHDHDVGEHR